jgi:hypothetical protein
MPSSRASCARRTPLPPRPESERCRAGTCRDLGELVPDSDSSRSGSSTGSRRSGSVVRPREGCAVVPRRQPRGSRPDARRLLDPARIAGLGRAGRLSPAALPRTSRLCASRRSTARCSGRVPRSTRTSPPVRHLRRRTSVSCSGDTSKGSRTTTSTARGDPARGCGPAHAAAAGGDRGGCDRRVLPVGGAGWRLRELPPRPDVGERAPGGHDLHPRSTTGELVPHGISVLVVEGGR